MDRCMTGLKVYDSEEGKNLPVHYTYRFASNRHAFLQQLAEGTTCPGESEHHQHLLASHVGQIKNLHGRWEPALAQKIVKGALSSFGAIPLDVKVVKRGSRTKAKQRLKVVKAKPPRRVKLRPRRKRQKDLPPKAKAKAKVKASSSPPKAAPTAKTASKPKAVPKPRGRPPKDHTEENRKKAEKQAKLAAHKKRQEEKAAQDSLGESGWQDALGDDPLLPGEADSEDEEYAFGGESWKPPRDDDQSPIPRTRPPDADGVWRLDPRKDLENAVSAVTIREAIEKERKRVTFLPPEDTPEMRVPTPKSSSSAPALPDIPFSPQWLERRVDRLRQAPALSKDPPSEASTDAEEDS